ncbi:MAG TPA: transcription-repair coupling factor [Deltaproteobacteria bacterium]|nr:transcription-repair coupling factor [Deltaproteobacteria bacterium]
MNRLIDALGSWRSIGLCPGSLQAFVVAAHFMRRKGTILWIVESSDEMYQLQQDLEAFLDKEHILVFPCLDARPYQDDSPSKEIMAVRIETLLKLSSGHPSIVIAPVSALLLFTIPPEDLDSSLITLCSDDELDRETLAQRLVHMGYTREALISDVGQFSIRGSLIDVFSPGMTLPVRIDTFGEILTSLREFDLASQRSKNVLDSTLVTPADEVLMDYSHMKNARQHLKRMQDPQLKHMIEDMERGIYPPAVESYLPLFYGRGATLFEYLPAKTRIVAPDESTLSSLWDEIRETYERSYDKALTRGRAFLGPERLLMERGAFLSAVRECSHRIESGLSQEPQGHPFTRIAHQSLPMRSTETALEYFISLKEEGFDCFIFVSSEMISERIEYALSLRGLKPRQITGENILWRQGWGGTIYLVPSVLSTGFTLPEYGIALISSDEVFGSRRRRKKPSSGLAVLNAFTQLKEGDPVVHRENGIGIFKGVVRLEPDGIKTDFILLEYLGGDKLYVPVYRLSLLQRYIGDIDHFTIDKLGGVRWSRAKKKAKESVAKLAGELLTIYARREASTRKNYDAPQNLIEEFEASFPYEETEDQLKALQDMYSDMASLRPMDRLICGDVGYGKTEVALRASFLSVMSGRQVAILVPTTLLARQHLNTFKERMAEWPIRVEALSSMSSALSIREIVDDLEQGKVDIVIGTHALLSDRIKFRDLGLLIVDEEHRFGVRHKERIKALRSSVDILTLTATPIPRTLNFAISGIRDLSIIETPPAERKSIDTVISRYDDEAVRETIVRELARGGQVFFVHNTVSTIESTARHIQVLCPEARVAVAHGQMSRAQLNRVMVGFLDRTTTVLVTSAIISSGIDIPSANTIIINRADKFGLADLYQLRGRVGRAKVKGHALFLVPEFGQITRDAHKRLSAIKEYESLGAGFQMALRDMEIRGVGDLLGGAQWGHLTAIGYELYQQMLKEAVDSLQGRVPQQEIDPEIRFDVDAYIPEEYCPDQHLRLGLYRRLFTAGYKDLSLIEEELVDLYGPMPNPMKMLLIIAEIRHMMRMMRLRKLEKSNNRLRLYVARDSMLDMKRMITAVTARKGKLYPEGMVDFPIGSKDASQEIRDILYSVCSPELDWM